MVFINVIVIPKSGQDATLRKYAVNLIRLSIESYFDFPIANLLLIRNVVYGNSVIQIHPRCKTEVQYRRSKRNL